MPRFLKSSGQKKKNRAGNRIMRLITLAVLAGLLAAPVPAVAEALSGGEFTFKRVKPPAPGAKRITVQIDPAEQARRLASFPDVVERTEKTTLDPVTKPDGTPAALAPVPAPKTSYAWFWDKVPTTIDARDGRFPAAIAALSQGPGGSAVRAPRMQQMQDIANRYGQEILKATLGTEVSPALALAVMGIESGGQADAVSSAGAEGLMQLIPATAERFGVSNSKDAVQNIRGGVAYLDWLMKRFDRDPLMVLAAYNAGEGAVEANGGVPPYAETRDYVPKVLAAWQVAQGLCLTPPELVTDPCVFRIISASN
jgi:membrane-bound lytic murein transglycosylase B